MTVLGSITDVAGVEVGHHQRTGRGWQTGSTVIVVPGGATPGVDVRGGGPGTRETEALAPENLVERIHAVCLTGGSAFGLAAAHGVMEVLEHRGLGVEIGGAVPGTVPVVPAAVIFDLGRGGRFANRPDADFGRLAAQRASRSPSRWGAVGAGTGARAGALQGGVGTASVTVRIPSGATDGREHASAPPTTVCTVGALAVVNASGSVADPSTGALWERTSAALRRPSAAEARRLRDLSIAPMPLNTTIGVVATDAALTKAEARKLASVAHDGLARAIRPAHSMSDGDTVFALSTGALDIGGGPTTLGAPDSRHHARNELLRAAADVFAAACVHAVLAATSVGEAPAYLDVCPSALRSGTDREWWT